MYAEPYSKYVIYIHSLNLWAYFFSYFFTKVSLESKSWHRISLGTEYYTIKRGFKLNLYVANVKFNFQFPLSFGVVFPQQPLAPYLLHVLVCLVH